MIFCKIRKVQKTFTVKKSFAAAAPTLAQDSDLWKDKLKEYATPEPWYARIPFLPPEEVSIGAPPLPSQRRGSL